MGEKTGIKVCSQKLVCACAYEKETVHLKME